MMKDTLNTGKTIPLSRVVAIPPKPFPSTNIVGDDITTLSNYLPSASTLEIVTRFSAGLRGAKSGRMLSITGPYGSGKSTMASFLTGLLAPKKSNEWKTASKILRREDEYYIGTLMRSRKTADIHKNGMIRCIVTARREPVSVTLLKALHNGLVAYFGKYTKRDFPTASLMASCMAEIKKGKIPDDHHVISIVEGVTKISPLIFIIDEFGKNIEYFATSESQKGDLFLLQELAERSGRSRGIPLSIITLQHMAFEEYAIGASSVQRQEWSKIQGRFEDIPFANSPDQTRLLISQMIKRGDGYTGALMGWASREAANVKSLGITSEPELIASCYPLGALALEVLPELCSRYGQHERTLLSFLSDSKKYTVSTFVDENHWDAENPPVMGLDSLYDFFISGTIMPRSSSATISRLMEIETIIRDAHDLDDAEIKTLKVIGLLNLIGRSGYLRASNNMIRHTVGGNYKKALARLEKKSIITYRKHADEYRIWRGTDIDIAAKLDSYYSRYRRTPLHILLRDNMDLIPLVAARHSIKTGTMRLFDRKIGNELGDSHGYDGVILYVTDDSPLPNTEIPVIIVTPGNTNDVKSAAVEVSAIQDILKSDDTVIADGVARNELEERLADAQTMLSRKFSETFGKDAKWEYEGKRLTGNPSTIVSEICDKVYAQTPIVRNEMINRTLLSSQGSAAKRKLLEVMIQHSDLPMLGIDGSGPERAIYTAVLYENKIHVSTAFSKWELRDPSDGSFVPVWNAILDAIKNSKGRVVLSDLYKIAMMPPYGAKDGPLQILAVAMMLIHKNNMALYEHGTFVHKLKIDVVERMTKNPEYFELKYFTPTKSKRLLLQQVSTTLGVDSGSVLDVVGKMAVTVSGLPPYMRNTKRLDKDTTAVRNTLLVATEPDTLLFESLPSALGFGARIRVTDIPKFSRKLAKSMNVLQNGFSNMFGDIESMLFRATGIEDRPKLSKAARIMNESVTDSQMKTFLGALSTDSLERTEDWINYVAMSLTDVPPVDWNDDQRKMFENNLSEASAKFKRLAGIHFTGISGSFTKPSYQVTVTRDDGSEHYDVVSLDKKQVKDLRQIASVIKKEMKKKGFSEKDLGSLLAILNSRMDKH